MSTAAVIDLPDPDATTRLAACLANCLSPDLCIWLSGDLGSGKTHLARGLLRALGWRAAVRSPTYTLLETYTIGDKPEAKSRFRLYHFDLYRLASPEEWSDAGFDDLAGPAVRLIEWPERGGACTPPPDLHLELSSAGAGRRLRVSFGTQAGEEAWQCLASLLRRQPADSALRWSQAC